MSEPKHLDRRDARDRLVDLLGLGETYPLRDVVVSDALKVPFNTPAKISIAPSQAGVRYELRDHDGDGPPDRRDGPLVRFSDGESTPVTALGTGEPLELMTPAIVEDITFTIHAAKSHPGEHGDPSSREVLLRTAVRVKVGLDLALPARIRLTGATAPLVPSQTRDRDPRLSDHGDRVTVEVDGAQEGVDYDLVSVDGGELVARSEQAVRGMSHGVTIAIESTPLHEDVVLRVRATKKFTLAEGRATEVSLLDAALPLKVRADPEVQVSAVAPIVDLGAEAAIRVTDTQASASYQLYARPVRDHEFAHLTPAGETVDVAVEGGHTVRVVRPPRERVWTDLSGFVAVGPPVPGGGDLELPLPALQADTLVLVRAAKLHAASPAVESAVQAAQAAVVLVRPDSAPDLELRVVLAGDATTGELEVLGGQPGVFYQFRRDPDGPDLGLPAYIHPRDDVDPTYNKGIGQTAVEVDLVVAEGRDEFAADDRARRAPPPPVLLTGPLPIGTRLHVLAVKAQSRVSAPLTRTAEITAVPAIAHEHPGVDAGQPARIHVLASDPNDRYQLKLSGVAVGPAQGGDGDELVLVSEAVTRDEVFEVEVSPRSDPGIAVHRVVPVIVPLRPATTLLARIVDGLPPAAGSPARLVAHVAQVRVRVEASEPGVLYRLVEQSGPEEHVLSDSVTGDGGAIELVLAHATEDVDLRVRALRPYFAGADESAQPQQTLAAVLPLQVRADPTLEVAVAPAPVVEFGAQPELVLPVSQRSAQYEVYVRPVADADYLHSNNPDEAVTVAVEGAPPVRVRRPPRAPVWTDLADFHRVGEASQGTGGELRLALPAATADLLVLVRASKHHGEGHTSAVQLDHAAIVLVAPDTQRPLTLGVELFKEMTGETVEIRGGEPGVFYTLLVDGAPIAEPAYFHRKHADDPALNLGVGALQVDLDLVVARDPAEHEDLDRATAEPMPPLVTTGPRPLGETWQVRATRMATRVTRPMLHTATIAAPPEIVADPATVAPGEAAAICVRKSVVGERYWLTRDGEPHGPARDGDGADLLFELGPLSQTTRFHVHILAPAGIAVERVVTALVVVETS